MPGAGGRKAQADHAPPQPAAGISTRPGRERDPHAAREAQRYDRPGAAPSLRALLPALLSLTFATVLTLIVTPCALMLRENVRDWREYRRQRRRIAQIKPIEGALGRKAAE